MTTAVVRGGDRWRDYFGWGMDRSIAANQFDMQAVIARAAGNWKKPPNFKPMPRPWDGAEHDSSPEGALDRLYAMFSGAQSGRR